MSSSYNRLVFLDIECSCDGNWSREEFYEKSELIEIGLTLFDNRREEIIDNRSIYFKAKNKLTDYCVNLTGITDNLLKKQGKTLEEGLNELKNHYPVSKPWFTWGFFDLRYLCGYFANKGLKFPLRDDKHVNLKLLYDSIMCNKRGTGLKQACKNLNINFDNKKHHSGYYDSFMACWIYINLFKI